MKHDHKQFLNPTPNPNPTWNQSAFIAWLSNQPADGTYDWQHPEACLYGQYFKTQGLDYSKCLPFSLVLPKGYYETAAPKPWTFGAALSRSTAIR